MGDEFAGAISLHGFKHFDRQFAFNDHQGHHLAMAQETPLPCDGLVKRILDLGCGWGEFATALEERFSEAEVWGIDVGAPRVRRAHRRAVNMNLAVNFAQRLGEDSKFDSGSFDIVTRSNPQFEAPATVLAKAGQWADHRYDMARWAPEYRASGRGDATLWPSGQHHLSLV